MSNAGESLEKEVAQLYREFGAEDVKHDMSLSGNQIDVFVIERTSSGTRVRIVIECKDLSKPVGIERTNRFALVFKCISEAKLADVGHIVSTSGFTRQAREAAKAAGIHLIDIEDLRQRQQNIKSQQLLSVCSATSNLIMAADGRVVGYTGSSGGLVGESVRHLSPDDNSIVKRVKLVAEYVKEIERLATDPTGTVVAVDITGTATGFSNWLSNPLYVAVLQANRDYAQSYRRVHGAKGIAVQRTFIVDPTDVTTESMENLSHTLSLHLQFGITPALIVRDSHVPVEVLADIANLADRVCVDYGRMEARDPQNVRLLDFIAPQSDRQFRRIRDRVAWTMDPKNVDALIESPSQISEVEQSMRSLISSKLKDRI